MSNKYFSMTNDLLAINEKALARKIKQYRACVSYAGGPTERVSEWLDDRRDALEIVSEYMHKRGFEAWIEERVVEDLE